LAAQVPPRPHWASVVQFVLQRLVARLHEPAAAPGHVASSVQAPKAGPVKSPSGPFGDAQMDATYAKLPWTSIAWSWLG